MHHCRVCFAPVGAIVRAYSVVTGALLTTFVGHTAPVSGVALHPTIARQIVTSSIDGSLRVWDADDGTCLKTIVTGLPLVRLASVTLPHGAAPRVYAVASIVIDTSLVTGGAAAAAGAGSKATGSDDDDDAVGELIDTSGAESDSGAQIAAAETYPLGDEPACLQVRPPAYAISSTLNERGGRRIPAISRVIEVDLAAGSITKIVLQRRGFVTGVEVRCFGLTSASSEAACGAGAASSSASSGRYASSKVPELAIVIAVRENLYIQRSNAHASHMAVYRTGKLLSALALHPTEPYLTVGEARGQMATWHVPELEAPSTFTYPPRPSPSEVLVPGTTFSTLVPLPGSAAAKRTEVHWHAHAAWDLNFVPDGSFLLSGGEESTLVIWQLTSALSGGAAGPSKDRRMMNFLPRLGAAIRNIVSYSAGATNAAKGKTGAGASAMEVDGNLSAAPSHVREAPPLIFAITCVDNSIIMVNGMTNKVMWKVYGLAVAGQPAALPTGLALFAKKALEKARGKQLLAAIDAGDKQAALRARAPSSALFPTPPLPSLLYACSRHLRKGVIIDPRTRSVIINGFPGRGSLQLLDPGTQSSSLEVDVGQRNLVSRADEEPAPPIRVTHAALSYDGSSMATIEVCAGTEPGSETSTLKFWNWNAAESRFALSTRVEAPHKTEVTVLEYHPSEHLVVTGSKDRTFKQWQREARMPVQASKAGSGLASASKKQDDDGDDDETADDGAAGKAAGAGAGSSKQAAQQQQPAAAAQPIFVWTCLSVGFYRDFHVTAGSFSGDGSLLALAYSHIVTLWSPKANALKKTLCYVTGAVTEGDDGNDGGSVVIGSKRGRSDGAAASGAAAVVGATKYAPVQNLAFIGLSPYLVAATTSSLIMWDLLTCTVSWSYSANKIISLTADRIGLASSDRFAVVVRDDDDTTNEARTGSNASKQQYHCVLFEAPSSTPIAVWALKSSRTHAGVAIGEPSLVNLSNKTAPGCISISKAGSKHAASAAAADVAIPEAATSAPVFVSAFVPPQAVLKSSAINAVRKAGQSQRDAALSASAQAGSNSNALFVLGPCNETYLLPTPASHAAGSSSTIRPLTSTSSSASSSAAAAGSSADAAAVVVVKSIAGAASVPLPSSPGLSGKPQQQTATGSKAGAVAVSASGGFVVQPTVAGSGTAALAGALAPNASKSAAAAPATSATALATTIASFGPVSAVQSPGYVFESLLGSLLPPRPQPAAAAGAAAGRASAAASGTGASVFANGVKKQRTGGDDDDEWAMDAGSNDNNDIADAAPPASSALPVLGSSLLGLFGGGQKSAAAVSATSNPASAVKAASSSSSDASAAASAAKPPKHRPASSTPAAIAAYAATPSPAVAKLQPAAGTPAAVTPAPATASGKKQTQPQPKGSQSAVSHVGTPSAASFSTPAAAKDSSQQRPSSHKRGSTGTSDVDVASSAAVIERRTATPAASSSSASKVASPSNAVIAGMRRKLSSAGSSGKRDAAANGNQDVEMDAGSGSSDHDADAGQTFASPAAAAPSPSRARSASQSKPAAAAAGASSGSKAPSAPSTGKGKGSGGISVAAAAPAAAAATSIASRRSTRSIGGAGSSGSKGAGK